MSSDSNTRTPLTDHPSSASGYDTYTDSGVNWLGEIPAHWELRALKYAADFVQEKLDSKPNDLPYIGLEHIESETGNLAKDEVLDDVSSKVVHFKKGDVLFGKLRPYLAKVLLTDEGGVGTTELVPLRPVNDVDERFLAYQLLSKGFIDVVDAQTYGARMPRVSPDQLAEQKIALPPLDEQRAIANFLDRATARIDALIEKKERLVELLEEKRSALVSHVVTKGLDEDAELQDSGVEWLGEIPTGWETAKIKLISKSLQTGPFGSKLHSSEYITGGIPVINPSHLLQGRIEPDDKVTVDEEVKDRLDRYTLRKGDIVFARRGELGRRALVTSNEEDWLCGTGSLRVRPELDEIYPPYLNRACSIDGVAEWLSLESVGSTMENLNTEILGNLPIPLPPLDEQRAIADHLDEKTAQIDTLIERVRDGIERLREYRTALLSAAVTGEIDVRDSANEEDEN